MKTFTTALLFVLAFAAQHAAAQMAMAPAAAPGPAPAVTIPTGPQTLLELSGAIIAACPGLGTFYTAPEYATFLSLGLTAGNETVDVPAGDIVAFTPTNDAFAELLASGAVSAAAITNSTLVGDVLEQHVASISGPDASAGVLLNGGSVEFQVGGNVVSLADALAAASTGTAQVMIMDPSGGMAEATINASASCPEAGLYAVSIDSVLLAPSMAVAPAPAPAPVPIATPAPAPAPSSASALFSGAAAAMGLLAVALI